MSSQWILLSGALCFRVSGKDARRYLHNRLSQDIRSMLPGQSVLAAALSAQGRVEGLFSVCCEGEDSFLIVCDGGSAEELLAVLRRFVVADRVRFDDISSGFRLVHLALSVESATEWVRSVGLVANCFIERARVAAEGADVLFAVGDHDGLMRALQLAFGEQLSSQTYARLRWEYGCAVYPQEINEQGMLLEFGLPQAVSFTKGCYVGQEVVERSDAIGKLPRRLERIVLNGAAPVGLGASISNQEGEILGKVVSEFSDSSEQKTYLFALLRTGKYNGGDQVVCAERVGAIVMLGLEA